MRGIRSVLSLVVHLSHFPLSLDVCCNELFLKSLPRRFKVMKKPRVYVLSNAVVSENSIVLYAAYCVQVRLDDLRVYYSALPCALPFNISSGVSSSALDTFAGIMTSSSEESAPPEGRLLDLCLTGDFLGPGL